MLTLPVRYVSIQSSFMFEGVEKGCADRVTCTTYLHDTKGFEV